MNIRKILSAAMFKIIYWSISFVLSVLSSLSIAVLEEKTKQSGIRQALVCFVNVWVVKWLHLLYKTLGFWSLAPTPLYM